MLWSCFINSLILQNALAVNFFFIGGEQNGSWTNKTMTCEFLAKQIPYFLPANLPKKSATQEGTFRVEQASCG